MRVIGLMSGTSADAVDAVLVDFRGDPNRPIWTILNYASVPYPRSIHEEVVLIGQGMKISSEKWLELSEAITELNFSAALLCDSSRTAALVGCHGQTIWHRSRDQNKRGGSLQMLQAPLLANLLQKPVVYDFRSKDIVKGGHGAPLVPLVDEALLGRINGWRAVLNLGGIANLTLIPPKSGPQRLFPVCGWDCGPANTLIDFAIKARTNGQLAFDRDGIIASKGIANLQVIEKWLQEPFFQRIPPKSTGREEFGQIDLKRRMNELEDISLENLLSTLTTFTASIVAQDLFNLYLNKKIAPIELLVAGGGVNNNFLMNQIRQRIRGLRIRNINEIGIHSQFREALAFATLTWWHVLKKPVFAKAVTGANQETVLGTYVSFL